MKKYTYILTFLFLLSMPFLTFGQKSTIWSLDACISRAQDKNLGVKQANVALSSAKTNYNLSQQAFLPNLNFSTTLNWNFGKSIDPTTNGFITQNFLSNNGGFFTDLTLYQGGALRNDLKAKRYNTLSSEATLEQQKRDIALQVSLVYLQILYQRDQIIIAEDQLNISQLQKKRIVKLIAVGNLPASDLYEIEAQLANNDQLLLLAKHNFQKSLLLLQQLIYLDVAESEGFQIETPNIAILEDNIQLSLSNKTLFKNSIKNEPAIAAKKWDIQASESNIKIAQSSYFPSLKLSSNLGAGYSELAKTPNFNIDWKESAPARINGVEQKLEFLSPSITGYDNIAYLDQLNQNIRYGASLSLNIPIYNRGQVNNRVQLAKLQNESAELAYESAIYKLKTDVSNALFDYKSSKQIWLAKTKTKEAKQLSFEQSKKLFELGNSSIFEYSVAKSSFENSQHEALNAKYDLLFKRKILDYYMGKKMTFNN